MLTVKGTANITDSIASIGIDGSISPLPNGYRVILMDATGKRKSDRRALEQNRGHGHGSRGHVGGAATIAAPRSTGAGLAVFGAVSGGRSSYQTGSHVEMDSQSLITGISSGADLAPE
jgi:hypothetical protein